MSRSLISLEEVLRRRFAEERGMTIVEAVVAALVLVIASLGVLQVVDASTRNTYRAEQNQVVVNRLQAELEEVRQLTYDEVALTAAPSHVADPAHPNWRVGDGTFALRRDGTSPAPLVSQGSPLEAGGSVGDTVAPAVDPGPEPFQSGDVSGQIHRYVVWINDEACGESCPGTQDLKRVVVVATLDQTGSGGTRAYQELQTDMVDPDTTPEDNPVAPGEDSEERPATFWLSDTPCNMSDRQPIVESHPTRNTHGRCADGPQFGDVAGAPDLMLTEQPPGDDPTVPEQPLFDYSIDIGEGPGLRMRPALDVGCHLPGELQAGEGEEQAKVHMWLSQPMPSAYELALTGEATLELWTKTVDAAAHPGRVCVWLFKRHVSGGQVTDTLTANVDPALQGAPYYHGHPDPAGGNWPEQWTEISVPMSFDALSLQPTERLGIAISVEREGSQAQDLELMYDHPSFVSRLEVKTTSDLEPLLGG